MAAPVELNEQFFAKIAGWDVIKQARAVLAGERVISSGWEPPVLKGVVQEGSTSYRAGLVIKDSIDIENLCPCRASRQWGTICVHSISVGLHYIRRTAPPEKNAPAPSAKSPLAPTPAASPAKSFRRVKRAAEGAPAELAIVFPPNLLQALPKGKVMLYVEAISSKGRTPLPALGLQDFYRFSKQDDAVLDVLEEIAGDTPAMLMAGHNELSRILAKLVEHPRVTLGKSQPLAVSSEPLGMRLKAILEGTGEITLSLRQTLAADSIVRGKSLSWIIQPNQIRPLSSSVSQNDSLSADTLVSTGE